MSSPPAVESPTFARMTSPGSTSVRLHQEGVDRIARCGAVEQRRIARLQPPQQRIEIRAVASHRLAMVADMHAHQRAHRIAVAGFEQQLLHDRIVDDALLRRGAGRAGCTRCRDTRRAAAARARVSSFPECAHCRFTLAACRAQLLARKTAGVPLQSRGSRRGRDAMPVCARVCAVRCTPRRSSFTGIPNAAMRGSCRSQAYRPPVAWPAMPSAGRARHRSRSRRSC